MRGFGRGLRARPSENFEPTVVVLGAFYHPWLTFGLVIDVVLVWAVTVAHWSPIGSTRPAGSCRR